LRDVVGPQTPITKYEYMYEMQRAHTSKVWMARDGFADLAKQRKVFVKARLSAKAICS
jgi:hypothetical protein